MESKITRIFLSREGDTVTVHRLLPKVYPDGSLGNNEESGSFVNSSCLDEDCEFIFPEFGDGEVYEFELKKVYDKNQLGELPTN